MENPYIPYPVKIDNIEVATKEHCKKFKEIVKPEIPGTLQANLKDYQIIGNAIKKLRVDILQ